MEYAISLNGFINEKYSVDPIYNLPTIYKFREYFLFNPCLFTVVINLVVLLALVVAGFGLIWFINVNTIRLYGDHCRFDMDCATDMNYICQNGECSCTSSTYYLSNKQGCGK